MSFLSATLVQKPFQHASLPWSVALQEESAWVRVPHGVTSPARKPDPMWAPISMRLQILSGACSIAGFPQGNSLHQANSLSSLESTVGCKWICHGPPWAAGGQHPSPWSSPWAAGASLLLCWSTSSPSITLLGSCKAVSRIYFHSSLCCNCTYFSHALKYFIPELLLPTLMGLASHSSRLILEPGLLDISQKPHP